MVVAVLICRFVLDRLEINLIGLIRLNTAEKLFSVTAISETFQRETSSRVSVKDLSIRQTKHKMNSTEISLVD